MRRREQQTLRTVVPAQSGWNLAIYLAAEGDEKHRFVEAPIIAWIIETVIYDDDEVSVLAPYPVTTEGSHENGGNFWAIKTPAGEYDFQLDAVYVTEERALQYCAEREAQQKEREAKKAAQVK